jgi:hypothetical protein
MHLLDDMIIASFFDMTIPNADVMFIYYDERLETLGCLIKEGILTSSQITTTTTTTTTTEICS